MSNMGTQGNGTWRPSPPHHQTAKPHPPSLASAREATGDIIYGARAIAGFMFGDDSNRARRRVFNLWAFHSARQERAGFFKLKGGLCLSIRQWRKFHGLD